jgi:sugar O-acyltransferase (sialic acid O-acetyltransferase NeuD family)
VPSPQTISEQVVPSAPRRTAHPAKPVLVYGGGEFGQVVRELVIDCGRSFAGFVDDWVKGPEIVGDSKSVFARSSAEDFEIAMAIGYRHLAARLEVFQKLTAVGYRFVSLVHPAAYVSSSARIGSGVQVMARAIVDRAAAVRDLVVLWPGANVSHDCEVGRNTFISPGAVLCGRVRLGHSCFVGAGAVITDGVAVPERTSIKAATRYSGHASAVQALSS